MTARRGREGPRPVERRRAREGPRPVERRRARDSERGAVGLTTLTAVVVGLMVAVAVGLGAADLGVAHARAGTAADAAALAAVGADPLVGGDGDHCAAAEALAAAGGATLESCAVARDPGGSPPMEVRVRVAVPPTTAVVVAAVSAVRAEAVAGLAPREARDCEPRAAGTECQ